VVDELDDDGNKGVKPEEEDQPLSLNATAPPAGAYAKRAEPAEPNTEPVPLDPKTQELRSELIKLQALQKERIQALQGDLSISERREAQFEHSNTVNMLHDISSGQYKGNVEQDLAAVRKQISDTEKAIKDDQAGPDTANSAEPKPIDAPKGTQTSNPDTQRLQELRGKCSDLRQKLEGVQTDNSEQQESVIRLKQRLDEKIKSIDEGTYKGDISRDLKVIAAQESALKASDAVAKLGTSIDAMQTQVQNMEARAASSAEPPKSSGNMKEGPKSAKDTLKDLEKEIKKLSGERLNLNDDAAEVYEKTYRDQQVDQSKIAPIQQKLDQNKEALEKALDTQRKILELDPEKNKKALARNGEMKAELAKEGRWDQQEIPGPKSQTTQPPTSSSTQDPPTPPPRTSSPQGSSTQDPPAPTPRTSSLQGTGGTGSSPTSTDAGTTEPTAGQEDKLPKHLQEKLDKFKDEGHKLLGNDHQAKQQKYADRADAANTKSFGDLYKEDMKSSWGRIKDTFQNAEVAKDENEAFAQLLMLLFEMIAFMLSPLSNVMNAAGDKAKNAIKEQFWNALADIQGEKFNDPSNQQKVLKGLEGQRDDIENKIFNIKEQRERHDAGSVKHNQLTNALKYQEAKLDVVNDSIAKTEKHLVEIQNKDLNKREGALNDKQQDLKDKNAELEQKKGALDPADTKNEEKLQKEIDNNAAQMQRNLNELERIDRDRQRIEETGKPNKVNNPEKTEKELDGLKNERDRLQRNIDSRNDQISNLGNSDPDQVSKLQARQEQFEARKNEIEGKIKDKEKEFKESLEEKGKRLEGEKKALEKENPKDDKKIKENNEAIEQNKQKLDKLNESTLQQGQTQAVGLGTPPPEQNDDEEEEILASNDEPAPQQNDDEEEEILASNDEPAPQQFFAGNENVDSMIKKAQARQDTSEPSPVADSEWDDDNDEVLNTQDANDKPQEVFNAQTGDGPDVGNESDAVTGPGGSDGVVDTQTPGTDEPVLTSSSPESEKPELTKENQKRLDDFIKSGESFLRGNDHEAKQKKFEDKADAANTKSVGDLWKDGMKAQAKSFKDTFTKGDVAKDENEAFEQLMRMIMEAVALLLSPGGQLVNALGQKGQNALKEFTFNKLAEYQGNKFNDPSAQQGVLKSLEGQRQDIEDKIFDLKQDQAKHEPGSREHTKIGKELDYQNAKLDVVNDNISRTEKHLKEIQNKDLDKREGSLLDAQKKLGEKDVKLKQELADLEAKDDPKNNDDIVDLKERINRNDEKIQRNNNELERIARDREALNKPDSGPLRPINPDKTEKELNDLTKERDKIDKAIESNKGPLESMKDGPDKDKLQAKQDVLTERRDQLNGKIDDKTDELEKSLKEQQERLQEEHRVLEIQSHKDAQNDLETNLRLQDDLKKNEKAQEENAKKQQDLADKKQATPEPDQQVAMGTAPPDPNTQTATFNASTGDMSDDSPTPAGGLGVGKETPPGGRKEEETVSAPEAESSAKPAAAQSDEELEQNIGADVSEGADKKRAARAGAPAPTGDPNAANDESGGPKFAAGAAAGAGGAAALASDDASADEVASADADEERTIDASADDGMNDAEDESNEAQLEQAMDDDLKAQPLSKEGNDQVDSMINKARQNAPDDQEGNEKEWEDELKAKGPTPSESDDDEDQEMEASAESASTKPTAPPLAKGEEEGAEAKDPLADASAPPMAEGEEEGAEAGDPLAAASAPPLAEGEEEGVEADDPLADASAPPLAEGEEEGAEAKDPLAAASAPPMEMGDSAPSAPSSGGGGSEEMPMDLESVMPSGGGAPSPGGGGGGGGSEEMPMDLESVMPSGGGAPSPGGGGGGSEEMPMDLESAMPSGGGGGMPSLGGGDEEKPKEKAKGDDGDKKGKEDDAAQDDPEYGPLTEASSKMLETVEKALECITNPTSAMGGDEAMQGMDVGGGKEAAAPKGEKGDKAEKGDGKEKKGGADLSKIGEGLPEEGKKLVGGICKVAGALLSMAEGVAGPQEKDTAEAMKAIEQFAKLVQDMAKVFKGGLSGGMGGGGGGGAKPDDKSPGGGGAEGLTQGGGAEMAEGMDGGMNPMSMAKDMETLKSDKATNGQKAEVAGKWAARAMGVPPPADAMVGKVVKAAVDKIDAMDPVKNTAALLNDMAEACHEATKPKNENEGDKALNNPDNSVAPMSEAAQAAQPPLKDMAKGPSQGMGQGGAPSLDSGGGDAKPAAKM